MTSQPSQYTLADLVYLMARLRDPQSGCPWDLKQNFHSIIPSTLEEVYEVVEAMERADKDNLREELGDLLFQVVFYSQLAREEHAFTVDDVIHGIVAKLVRRHPHVFPSGNLYDKESSARDLSDEAVVAQWERIKQTEKQVESKKMGLLDGIPRALPALQRAYKLQKKMASVDFDWKQVAEVIPVVEAEWRELGEAIASENADAIEEEMGDMLFALVNLARHLKLDPETALRRSNLKVEQRFAYIEQQLAMRGSTVAEASQAEMEALWQQAKTGVKPG